MALVVTGMHRSGTSAVARLVDGLGLVPGRGEFMEPVPENPRGFFERVDVANFNDTWLNRLGGAWDAPPRASSADFARLPDSMFHEARAELDLFSADSGPWYVKDPRISLLLPVWDRLTLRALPAILVVRSPREVSQSLRLRNSFPARLGLSLWLAYTNAVLSAAPLRDLLIIDYGRLLAEPAATTSQIFDFLTEVGELSGDGRNAKSDAELGALVEPGLRRQQSAGLDRIGELMLDDLAEFYDSLSALHGQKLSGQMDPLPPPTWVDEALDDASQLWRTRAEADARVKLALHERDAMERDLRPLLDRLAAFKASRSFKYAMKVQDATRRARERTGSRKES